jgi:hypothetical protein
VPQERLELGIAHLQVMAHATEAVEPLDPLDIGVFRRDVEVRQPNPIAIFLERVGDLRLGT